MAKERHSLPFKRKQTVEKDAIPLVIIGLCLTKHPQQPMYIWLNVERVQ
ncbi:MAG: hypothetical protein RL226_70 [Bacteroidota bacterium]|jgi:hypothetical protein